MSAATMPTALNAAVIRPTLGRPPGRSLEGSGHLVAVGGSVRPDSPAAAPEGDCRATSRETRRGRGRFQRAERRQPAAARYGESPATPIGTWFAHRHRARGLVALRW